MADQPDQVRARSAPEPAEGELKPAAAEPALEPIVPATGGFYHHQEDEEAHGRVQEAAGDEGGSSGHHSSSLGSNHSHHLPSHYRHHGHHSHSHHTSSAHYHNENAHLGFGKPDRIPHAPLAEGLKLPSYAVLPPEPIPIPPPPGHRDPNYWGKLQGEVEKLPEQPDPTKDMHDVIVVGAGLSGLTNAYRILETAALLGEKPKVIVLDSASKFGGRTRSRDPFPEMKPFDDKAGHISYGGTWVMLDNYALLSLSWDLDHLPYQPKLFPNFTKYAVNWQLLVTHPYLVIKMRTLGSKIWNAKPGTAEFTDLLKYDRMSVEQWLDEEAVGMPYPEHAKQAVRDWCYQGENFPQRPEHLCYMSAYFLARMIYVRMSHIAQTGLMVPKIMRWENGTGEIVTRLVDKVRKYGGYLYPETRVEKCVSHHDHVEVHVSTGGEHQRHEVYRTRRVVMAGAPHAVAEIKYHPDPLPQHHIDFARSLRLWDDTGTQVVLVWDTCWWNKKHLSCIMLPPPDDEAMGVYGACMDLSDHGPADREQYEWRNHHPLPLKCGVIRFLVKSSRLKNPDGSTWDTDKVKWSAFQYLSKFGMLKKTPEDLDKGFLRCWVWNHEWNPDTLGTAFFATPSDVYGRNVPDCAKPFGLIHFVGSERSTRGTQWMDGAVNIGQKKAPEVVRALYPNKFGDAQHEQYKDRIQQSEDQAIALLRKTLTHHGVQYLFEMIGRFGRSVLKNAIQYLKAKRVLKWDALPPPLPPKARYHLETKALAKEATESAADAMQQDEHLFSHPMGKFRLDLSDQGTVILQHLREGHKHPDKQWESNRGPPVPGPYFLVLQRNGNLELRTKAEGKSDTVIWHTNTEPPVGKYVSYRFYLGDDRGVNLYGYYGNGSRQVIWSSHTWEVHNSRPNLRDERVKFRDKLAGIHATLTGHIHQHYRAPEGDKETQIYQEFFKQQAKEREYGRMFARVPVPQSVAEGGREPDRLLEGGSMTEGKGLLSPHGHYHFMVKEGTLVLTHKRHGLHPRHPTEEVWRLPVALPKTNDAVLRLTAEGQLELYHGANRVWQSEKPAKKRNPFVFHVQDDANAVVYDKKCKPLWSTESACEPDIPYSDIDELNEVYD